MCRKRKVRISVRMWAPSTSASVMMISLWYRAFAMSKSSSMPVPIAVIMAWISVLERTLSIRAFSTLMILPRSGRIAWKLDWRAIMAEPPAESPSTTKISVLAGSRSEQSCELARQARRVHRALAARQVARLAGGEPGL